MSKNIMLVFLLILILSFIGYIIFFRPTPTNLTKLNINNKEFQLEIAKTNSQKAKGLSNRQNLCSNCGMIFVFEKDKTLPFWMKDTLIPLDIVWINSQGIIVSIQTATPEPNTSFYKLKIYQNSTPAQYVIELNGGESEKLKLKIGDTINLSNL